MYDDGNITEATTSNIWIIKNKYSPTFEKNILRVTEKIFEIAKNPSKAKEKEIKIVRSLM